MSDDEPCEDCGEVHGDIDSIFVTNPLDPGTIEKVNIKLSEVHQRLKEDGHDRKSFPLRSVMKVGRFVERMLDEAFSAKLNSDKVALRQYRKLIRSTKNWMREIGCVAVFDLAREMHLSNSRMFLEYEAQQAKKDIMKGADPEDPIYKLLS
jgi:hypothetical protein